MARPVRPHNQDERASSTRQERAQRGRSGCLGGLRLCMVMHVSNSDGSRAWPGLLGPQARLGNRPAPINGSAKDPSTDTRRGCVDLAKTRASSFRSGFVHRDAHADSGKPRRWRTSCQRTDPKQRPSYRQRLKPISQIPPQPHRLLHSGIGKAVCGQSLGTRQGSSGRR